MQKRTRLIAGFLAVAIIISLVVCSAGKKSLAANMESDNAVLSDLPLYSCTWRMTEFLDSTFYDEYMHDNGQRFQSLMSFTEKLQSSEEITFAPYTCNLVELLNITIPDQCMVNYGTDFAGESVYDIAGETAIAAEALQVTDTLTFFDIHSTKADQFGFCMDMGDGRRLTCCGDEPYDPCEEEYARDSEWLLHEAFCLYSQADIFDPYEKHHSTVKDACELAERLGVKNMLLYHTEDRNLANRKEMYQEEGMKYYHGNLWIPDDLETIEL